MDDIILYQLINNQIFLKKTSTLGISESNSGIESEI